MASLAEIANFSRPLAVDGRAISFGSHLTRALEATLDGDLDDERFAREVLFDPEAIAAVHQDDPAEYQACLRRVGAWNAAAVRVRETAKKTVDISKLTPQRKSELVKAWAGLSKQMGMEGTVLTQEIFDALLHQIREMNEMARQVKDLMAQPSKDLYAIAVLDYDLLRDLYGIPGREKEITSRAKKERISSLPEFQAHAAENQWKTRRERGLPWKQDVFEYVRDVYGSWIDRGTQEGRPLTQADLKAVDEPLWQKFQQESSKRGVPEWLALPTDKRPLDEGVTDPELLKEIEAFRKVNRQRVQASRARHKT